MELNMNIEERAAKYAAERANKVFADALAEAYKDGYRDGYNDHKDNPMVELMSDYDEVEYVDLGLPSGTLWSKDYLRKDGKIIYLPFCEAKKFTLPTEEQWKELRTYCRPTHLTVSPKFNYAFTSRIGSGIMFEKCSDCYDGNGFNTFFADVLRFWLNEKVDEVNWIGRIVRLINPKERKNTDKVDPNELRSMFVGYKLPVRLVKQKEMQ